MKIRGSTVGFPNPQSNWEQTDDTQADYIKNKPPIRVASDGYLDIDGLRRMVGAKFVKSVVGSDTTVTVTQTLEGYVSSTSVVSVDIDGFPTKVVTDGVECTLDWEGFD